MTFGFWFGLRLGPGLGLGRGLSLGLSLGLGCDCGWNVCVVFIVRRWWVARAFQPSLLCSLPRLGLGRLHGGALQRVHGTTRDAVVCAPLARR